MNKLPVRHTNGNLSGYFPTTPKMGLGLVLVLGVGAYYLYKAMSKKAKR